MGGSRTSTGLDSRTALIAWTRTRGGLNAYRGAGATPQQVGQVGGWSTLEGMEPYDESGTTTSRALSVLVAGQSALAVAVDVDRGGGGGRRAPRF